MFDAWIGPALVVDGSGERPFIGSVGVRDGRIVVVERDSSAPARPARIQLDAAGLALAPGFVDVHNHSDLAPLLHPAMTSTVRQGVTTVVVGNCGMSPFPAAGARELATLVVGDRAPDTLSFASFGEFLERLDAANPAVHVAALIGHGSVREAVMGLERRPPAAPELAAMAGAVAEAMEAGAIGLSSGLIYAPGLYATTDEVVIVAREAARTGGVYASHIRGEGRNLFAAIDEAIAIGARAGLSVHVSHLKCEGSHAWGRASEALERIHSADDCTADQYPYAAWASSLASLLPDWAPVRDIERLLADPGTAARLAREVEAGRGETFQSAVDGVGWGRIVIETTADRSCVGLDIAAIARRRHVDPARACFELLVEDPMTTCIGHAMRDDDVRTILADPAVFVASDAVAMDPAGPMGAVPVHPRNYGTFPRVLGPSVRDGTLTLADAVRKMTSLPAQRFGLAGRGRISTGAWADLVLFDPTTISDTATFERPHALPVGVEAVLVDGIVAWRRGSDEITRAGGVIRRGDR